MIEFIKKYPQLLLFGILTAMFSGPGQTFLISFFIPHMRDEFSLSQTQIASLYSAATLISALLLPLMGRLLDRLRLVWFTLIAGFLLAVGCLILSRSQGLLAILIGFLLIRNLGQGTLSMVSSTTMARVFGMMRGKALGVANLGYPLSEALFPFFVSSWILAHGWRSGWVLLASLTILFFLPVMFLLIHRDTHKKTQEAIEKKENELKKESEELEHEIQKSMHWSVGQVLHDVRFYFLIIPIMIPASFLTALFFHHAAFLAWKGWSVQIIALAFTAFGICRAIMSFLIGPLVDRYSAQRLFPYTLIPLGLGLISFLLGSHLVWIFIYLIGAGITLGFGRTVSGAMWAELYGTKHLGSIRGLLTAIIVCSTAISPLLIGILLDHNVPHQNILMTMVLLLLVGVVIAWNVLHWKKR